MSAFSMAAAPIALTCGEPASIAPEITAKAWIALHQDPTACFFLIGDGQDVFDRTNLGDHNVPIVMIDDPAHAAEIFPNALPILNVTAPKRSRAAWIDTRNSQFVIDVIKLATSLCMDGRASAMVTNPIHKDALYAVGFRHQGHTDFLASLVATDGTVVQEVMMLVAAGLRCVPITVHMPLADVPTHLTTEAIVAQGRVVATGLQKWFGVEQPRLWVTGLNPHAGENGAMGHEEKNLIEPAVAQLRRLGIEVHGPVSADTAFHAEARAHYDAVLCMYHDQALIPIKTLDFHGGVNVTLGLPFIRTSPDHGTALNLAGSGTARPDSLIAAIKLAAEMVARRA